MKKKIQTETLDDDSRDELLLRRPYFTRTNLDFIRAQLKDNPGQAFDYEGVKTAFIPLNYSAWLKHTWIHRSDEGLDPQDIANGKQVGIHILNIEGDVSNSIEISLQGLENILGEDVKRVKGVSLYTAQDFVHPVPGRVLESKTTTDYVMVLDGDPPALHRLTPVGYRDISNHGYETLGTARMFSLNMPWSLR